MNNDGIYNNKKDMFSNKNLLLLTKDLCFSGFFLSVDLINWGYLKCSQC